VKKPPRKPESNFLIPSSPGRRASVLRLRSLRRAEPDLEKLAMALLMLAEPRSPPGSKTPLRRSVPLMVRPDVSVWQSAIAATDDGHPVPEP
jgi:hypothetical protein